MRLKYHLHKGAAPLFTLAVALGTAIFLLLVLSSEPGKTLYHFFAGPLANPLAFGNMLGSFTLLLLSGLAMSFSFKGGLFNLGGEGQIYTGGIAAVAILLAFPQINSFSGITLSLFSAALAGGVLASISSFLKNRYDVDELISSFLISAGMIHIVDYLITGPLSDSDSYLITTASIEKQFRFTHLLGASTLNSSIFGALIVIFLSAFFLYYTKGGYELRICGLNGEFARYGGLNRKKYISIPLITSGAISGLTGGVAILGIHYSVIKGFSAGMGWNGIAVALIASSHPIALIPSALIFSYLNQGAQSAMVGSDFPFALGGFIQAVVFLLISSKLIGEKLGGKS